MNKKKQILAGLLLAALLVPLQGAQDLTLTGAIQTGLEHNFGIRISRQNLEIARNNNTWGAAGRYPVIDLNLGQSNSFTDRPSTSAGDTRDKFTTNTLTPSLTMRWTLFNGFGIKIAKQKLMLLNDLSEGNAAIMVENTIQGIVLAYYNVLLQQEKLATVQTVQKLSQDRFQYVKDRKALGTATTFDELQAKIAYLDDTSAVLLQEFSLNSARRALNLLLGQPEHTAYNLTDKFEAPLDNYNIDPLLEKMKQGNKTLRNQYISQHILRKDVALQKSALWPKLSLNSGAQLTNTRLKYEGLSAATSNTYNYYVNFTLSLNIFNGGNTKRAIANARIQEKIGNLQMEEIQLTLENTLRNILELYNARKQLFRVAEERIKSAKLNMDISTEKFRAGAINSFNYRDVQLLYLNSAIGSYQAIYDLIETHTDLARLTGGIISEY